jgi:hypothetical protein
MTFEMLVARKELLGCFMKDRDQPTLCNLPVDPLDATCRAMAHVDPKISDLAKEIILHTLVTAACTSSSHGREVVLTVLT